MVFPFNDNEKFDLETFVIYQCTQCDYLVLNDSIRRDDQVVGELYSDGMRHLRYMDDWPIITRCVKCGTIFWMREANAKIKVPWYKDIEEPYLSVQNAIPLDIFDLMDCVEENFFNNVDEELYLRTRLVWRFNDRYRFTQAPLYFTLREKEIWFSNLRKMRAMLDFHDFHERLMLAEVQRYLRNFAECMDIIGTFPYELKWMWEKYLFHCFQKNEYVFRLY